jgi:hypothetical protein
VNEDQHFALVLVFFFGGIMPLVLAYAIPAAKARARRLEAESAPQTSPDPRLYEEVDALRSRVGELEERLDFTERMLTQQQEHARLTEGK